LQELAAELQRALEPVAQAIDHASKLIHPALRQRRSRIGQPDEPEETTDSLRPVVADAVREARETAAWTQAALAEAMGRLGFGWQRVTVAEVESLRRYVSIEELIGLAILFGRPAVSFMIPRSNLRLQLTDDLLLTDHDVDELLTGAEGVNDGGLHWHLPRQLASQDVDDVESDWRPARDYWHFKEAEE
jgi:transcriptional regulator with XRE-family HTH domain